MTARQSVLIAMFLTVTIYILANVNAKSLSTKVGNLQQVPAPKPQGIVYGSPIREAVA